MSLQMFRLDSEKPEESKIRLPTSVGSWEKQENSRMASTSALCTTPKVLTVWDHNKLWKILQEMGIPANLTCFQRTLYAGRKKTVRTSHWPTDSFHIAKRVRQGFILSPCFFNWYSEDIMRNAGTGWSTRWTQDCGVKFQSPHIYRRHHPYSRNQRGTKEPLDESERKVWKCWLRMQHSKKSDHGIWSHHLVANKWGNNGKSDRLYPWSSKISAGGDCSYEIRRRLLLGRKLMP